MSTQIFIKPDGCKIEYTKINAQSFTFNRVELNSYAKELEFGASTGESPVAIWSGTFFDYVKQLPPVLTTWEQPMGIPLPINLVADDKVTISGTAVALGYEEYLTLGFDVYLTIGVYYFDCTTKKVEQIPAYTFIPIEHFQLGDAGSICFETSVTLGSNFDVHQTRFLVGFNLSAICPTGDCENPMGIPTTSVSYTFDIERPCAATIDNFIIRNCCEPIITELVHIPGLTVGNFHVDDEGNCWEVIEASKDVTNFTRNFVDVYTSCVECQTANPCPLNLIISSCCVNGKEFVTGSLPGLNVGDTFVDNHGLCWTVQQETGAPLSEESITVVEEILGDCITCSDLYPCPKFWGVKSCCGQIKEVIATTTTLNVADVFVDTNGLCWVVQKENNQLPTNYNIIVDTVYSGPGACETCKIANPCPTEYFLTVRMCCDPNRVEVISVPSEFMVFNEGIIFRDGIGICWEVMSYSTTGVETYPIDWATIKFGIYPACDICINGQGKERACVNLYKVRDCNTNSIYTAAIKNALLNVGSFYPGASTGTFPFASCFEVLGYGYPTIDPLEIVLGVNESFTCEECNINN